MRIRVFDLSSPAGLWNTSPPAATVRVGGQAGARSCTTDPPWTVHRRSMHLKEKLQSASYKQETVEWDTDSDSDESDDEKDLVQ